MSQLFNMLSSVVKAFLPRSKRLLISWLQSLSAVILEPPKIKSATVSTVSPSICPEVMGPDATILVFWMLSFKLTFSLCFSPSLRGSLVLHFLPEEWCHLHIWGYWYFFWQSWFQLMLPPAQHFSWCTLYISYISRVTIYSLDVLSSRFGTSLLFHSSSNCCFLTCIQISQETGIPDHLTCLLRNLYAGQEATVRTGMEQQTGSKSGKESIKAVYCYPAYLIYMQSTPEKCWTEWSTCWNQDCQEKYQ